MAVTVGGREMTWVMPCSHKRSTPKALRSLPVALALVVRATHACLICCASFRIWAVSTYIAY